MGGDSALWRRKVDYTNVQIDEVLSSNTIVLENGEKIILIGLKALDLPPRERKKDTRDKFGFAIKEEVDPTSTLEQRALEFLKDLLEKKHVRIEFDVSRQDFDFNTLGYVFLEDSTFANAEILREGYAYLTISPPNTKYEEDLRAAYKESRKEKRGVQSN